MKNDVIVQNTAFVEQNYLKVLTYGYSGVGKTKFAGTAPAPLFLDIEGGLLTLRDQHIDVVTIRRWEDVSDCFMYLRDGDHKYNTVVVDSLTELQKVLCDHYVDGKERLTLGDWGLIIDKTRRFVRHLKNLPMNVIVIALAEQKKDEECGRIYTVPSLNGKALPHELAAYFDLVLYQYVEQDNDGIHYLARTYGDKRIVAKDRSGILSPVIKPVFNEIYTAVFKNTGNNSE
jgi:hypothetical protein